MSRKNFKVEYLGKFEAIFKNNLGGYSGTPGWLNHEKNRRSKISWHCPFNGAKKIGPLTCYSAATKKLHQIIRFNGPISKLCLSVICYDHNIYFSDNYNHSM